MAPAIERIFAAQPVPIGGGSIIASPFQFLLTGEDNLFLFTWCARSSVFVVVAGRVLRQDGSIEPFSFQVPITGNRLQNAHQFTVGPGFILNVSVVATNVTLVSGECFVSLRLGRGFTGGITYLGTISQGYITNSQGISFPGSPIQLSTDGPGVLRQFSGTDPAVSIELDETVPTGARWELVSFFSQLVTDATVGARAPVLRLETSGGGIMAQSAANVGVTASSSRGFGWAQGMPIETNIGSIGVAQMGLPTNPTLIAGNHILTVTANIAAGDNWQAPDIIVKEWLEANA